LPSSFSYIVPPAPSSPPRRVQPPATTHPPLGTMPPPPRPPPPPEKFGTNINYPITAILNVNGGASSSGGGGLQRPHQRADPARLHSTFRQRMLYRTTRARRLIRVSQISIYASCNSAILTTTQNRRAKHLGVCRSQKRYNFFLANSLLIAKFPRPTLHTSNTVDKLNKSKSSGLVNVFTLVLPLVRWWCCCCCLFFRQSMTVSSIMMVAVVAVAAWRQRQHRRWRRWRRWPTIGGKSSQRQERQWLHDGVR
jgi:hypothetical protein